MGWGGRRRNICASSDMGSALAAGGFTDLTFDSLPYLFDVNGWPKPAYTSVLSLLQRNISSGCQEVILVRYLIPANTTTTSLSYAGECASFASSSLPCSDDWTPSGEATLTVLSDTDLIRSHDDDGYFGFVSNRTQAWNNVSPTVLQP